ncbi:MAG: HEAT repeat domain-containing protein [Thermoguttaceae bacterium]
MTTTNLYRTTVCFVLAIAAAVPLAAQSWLMVPANELDANLGQLTQTILATTDEGKLVEVIAEPGAENAQIFIKMLACKQLGIHGTAKSVPALVACLDQDKMSHYARYALETIPGPEVDAALRKAATTLKGLHQIGVINSLGVRRDKESVALFRDMLKGADESQTKAIYYALGNIATRETANILGEISESVPDSLERNWTDALFNTANKLANEGDIEAPAVIYLLESERNMESEKMNYLCEAAVYHLLLWNCGVGESKHLSKTADVLTNEGDTNNFTFPAALKAIRELPPGDAVTKAVIDVFASLPVERQCLVAMALGDRTDAASVKVALPKLVELAKSDDAQLRTAAAAALWRIGDASVVPLLLSLANNDNAEISAAATRTLCDMRAKGIDEAITATLAKGAVPITVVTLQIVKDRRIASASEILEKIAKDAANPLRFQAIDALGETANPSEIGFLAELFATLSGDDAEKVRVALNGVCARMPQKECFEQAASLVKTGSPAIKMSAMELLKTIGGADAVKMVTEIALTGDEAMQDKATQVLGSWDSPDTMDAIAAALLRVATESKDNKFKVRGIRGYIRLARQFNFPEEQRLAMIDKAFKTSFRNDERLLIFDIFPRYPSIAMLKAAAAYIGDANVSDKACESVVACADKLMSMNVRSPEIVKALDSVIAKTQNADLKNKANDIRERQLAGSTADRIRRLKESEGELAITIAKATYGAGNQQADVTAKLREFLNGTRLLDVPMYNTVFGDPAGGVVKQLVIEYTLPGGETKKVTLLENEPVMLPK